jgi:FKBP-type peptidyl-prolyl cis-trans isomerase SlyD
MTEKIQHHDFIEIDYTGKLTDGTVFDTTVEKVAKGSGIGNEKSKFAPLVVCVGERQVLPGLDDSLEGKEVNQKFEVNIAAENAFGKRDVKKMKIVPMSTFKEHNVQPQPGLQIDVDGEKGLVSRVSGGRVIVNFNHPLAGKEVVYEVEIKRKVTDKAEMLRTFLNSTLRIPVDKIKAEVKEDVAEIKMPIQLPEQFTNGAGKKLAELVKLKEVKFSVDKKEEKK